MMGWLRSIPEIWGAWVLAQGERQPNFLLDFPWIPFVIIGLMFYFLMIRPERKRRAEMATMLENLKKNDRVVTIGGIHGVVVNVAKGTEEVTIRVDEASNTKLRVLRSAISRVITEGESADKMAAG